jgi:hypothetical protein
LLVFEHKWIRTLKERVKNIFNAKKAYYSRGPRKYVNWIVSKPAEVMGILLVSFVAR